MFESNIILNEETIKELKVHAIHPKKKKFNIILSIICSIIGLLIIALGVVLSDTLVIIVGFFVEVMVAILIWAIFYVQNVFQKTNMEMIKEVSKTNGIEIETIFNEDNVVINNLTISAKVEIGYESFARFAETSSMYILFTGSSQQVYMSKKCLNEEEMNSFKGFIKQKCKNIKL